MVEWLVDDAGVALDLVTGFRYPGHSRERMHAPDDRAGTTLMRDLRRATDSRDGVEVVLDAPATGLVVDDAGRVTGCLVSHGGRLERVRAGAVVLASNGFGANTAMMRALPRDRRGALPRRRGHTGGPSWGREPAATRFMDAYRATPRSPCRTTCWSLRDGDGGRHHRQPRRCLLRRRGPWLPEYATGKSSSRGVGVLVYDDRIHSLAAAFDDYRTGPSGRGAPGADGGGTGRAHGRRRRRAEATLAYGATAGDAADDVGRTDARVLEAPYRAVRVSGALFHTQGGLVVDEHARVRRPDGSTIEGLYATGGVAEGLSGSGSGGYMSGNGLLSALGLGWLAGRHATAVPTS
jgi:fumarate reductase flavoprotein subunit